VRSANVEIRSQKCIFPLSSTMKETVLLCRPSDRSHPRVSQMTEFFLTFSRKKIHAKSTKRQKDRSIIQTVRIGPPLALLIIPFPSTIIEHSLLLCGMIIFHQMSHRLAAHSRQDSRRSNSLSQEALAALLFGGCRQHSWVSLF